MDRPNNTKGDNQPQIPFYIFPILLLIWVFIAIGSFVRRILGTILSVPIRAYNTLKTFGKEFKVGIRSWIQEKKHIVTVSLGRKKETITHSRKQQVKLGYKNSKLSIQEKKQRIISVLKAIGPAIRTWIKETKRVRGERKLIKENKQLQLKIATEELKESIEKRLTPIQGNYKSLTTNLENIQGATKQYMSQCSEAKIRPMKNDCKEILCSSKSEREIEDLLIQKLLCKEECPIVKNNIPQEKCFKKK